MCFILTCDLKMASFLPGDLCLGSVQVLIAVLAAVGLVFLLKSFLPRAKVSDFHKKYVLITGCDTGFGKKTAILLDHLGFHVIATCLTKQGKEQIQEACSDRLFSTVMDVTDSRQIQNVYEEVKKLIPDNRGLWAVVNNAGYITIAPLEWFKLDEYKRMADVNLWGLIDVTKTFLPLVKKAKGRIVNFSSVAGRVSLPGFSPYCVTKFGVEAFSDALRREMVTWDVKVCILEPHAFQTPLWKEIASKKIMSLWNDLSDEMREEYGEEFLKNYRQRLETYWKNSSTDTDLVVNAVIDAVISRDPKTRYVVGDKVPYFTFIALLPTSLQDYILKGR